MRKALTDEEWAGQPALSTGAPTNVVYWEGDNLVVDGWFDGSERHALAALCLNGQPFGFTHAMVDAIREVSFMSEGNRSMHRNEDNALAELAADLIEALLPPRAL